MDFRTFFHGLPKDQRGPFAERVESTEGHLNNVAYGLRTPATDLSVLIEQASEGAVTRQELRPSDYWKHWPDLPAPAGDNPAVPQKAEA